ncbi:FliO/MopB family protein [Agromyces soli]|uniref:Flagellar biosynthetic protein FliO n=1 Tax=Agromyces soli TaxID=659012 RepID=A0ABY4AY15_9MICO|nr:flagellar biosynthetic protein FliO [Agromyces soli]UOE27307.1 flagellar biosynthetic protein FliO [Agromyces soli]
MDAVFLVLRVVVALGVVLAVIWVAHRQLSRRRSGSKKASLVQVVARQSLSPKASVAIVDADGRRLVLGVTEHGVSVLSDRPAPVPDAEFDAVLAAAVAPAEPVPVEASAQPSAARREDDVLDGLDALAIFDEPSADADAPVTRRAALAAASTAPASHGSRRGSILSAETWKRSLAGVKEGLGI